MQQAYQLALQAQLDQEVPVGAVVVSADNQLLGRGYNRIIQSGDPTQHAEMLAIREAASQLQNYRLENCTLYVTLEPCCMCAGAIVHARLKRLVFAARDFKAGAAGSVMNLLKGFPLNHKVIVDEGLMQEQCGQLLVDFFKDCR